MQHRAKAFTLIELLVVIVIIVILSTVGVATFGENQKKARIAKNEAECKQIDDCYTAIAACAEGGASGCFGICNVDELTCSSGGIFYPPESEWTETTCFNAVFTASPIPFISTYNTSCGGLDVVIPPERNGVVVENILNAAFSNDGLTSVAIPDGVTAIGTSSFSGNELTSIAIPESVTTIGPLAFVSNDLRSIRLPEVLTTLGYNAFSNNKISSVIIPDGITTIEQGLFYLNELAWVVIPDGVTTIGDAAFANNRLTSVTIPDSVVSIDIRAFLDNPLSSVSIKATTSYQSNSFPPGCTVASGCITVRP